MVALPLRLRLSAFLKRRYPFPPPSSAFDSCLHRIWIRLGLTYLWGGARVRCLSGNEFPLTLIRQVPSKERGINSVDRTTYLSRASKHLQNFISDPPLVDHQQVNSLRLFLSLSSNPSRPPFSTQHNALPSHSLNNHAFPTTRSSSLLLLPLSLETSRLLSQFCRQSSERCDR